MYSPDDPQMDKDPLDSLLDLEEDYYQEGYLLGEADGAHAGYVEGKLFGIEKGYEKALEMGKLHGKALVWKYRLTHEEAKPSSEDVQDLSNQDLKEMNEAFEKLPELQNSSRLMSQVDQLLSITNPRNLSMSNDDDSVADFDERLKKAAAKVKIISRMIGERETPSEQRGTQQQGDGSGNIEDLSSLSARH